MRASLLCSLSFLWVSCDYGVDFEVQNETDKNIDSLIITNGFDSLKLYDIDSGEKKLGFLDFNKKTPKQDGAYTVQLFTKDSSIKKPFGYYSNGLPLVDSYVIILKKDSIYIKEDVE
ncbi:hypothetical protein J0X14_17875 [Muricauda sp. CAU 1633]|uniref:hypothetical protein n=1 Tax=Allomuricauda sp. CAU 1633 TaxID=2816036 RepID=UPI001A8E75AA|nr:hypothetical protein [Muricauda sp. CAU 1633]MBO0324183.1 hypothetical protein [Muricauda sp. CAU 1633]